MFTKASNLSRLTAVRHPSLTAAKAGTTTAATTAPKAGATTAPKPGTNTTPTIVPTPPANDFTITISKAAHIQLSGGNSKATHRLMTSGQGMVRMLFLGRDEELLDDRYFPAGQATFTPAGTREIVLLHGGTLPPVVNTPGALGLADNIGIEADTVAVAISPNTFAGHGCVVRSSGPLHSSPTLFDVLPGSELLNALVNFTVQFPTMQKGVTLIMVVEPRTAEPGPALDQVRWAALDATLSGLWTVVGTGRTAFVSTVDAGRPWQLDVDLGPDWKVSSIVVTPTAARSMADALRQSADWDFIDDRIQTGSQSLPIGINFEVAK